MYLLKKCAAKPSDNPILLYYTVPEKTLNAMDLGIFFILLTSEIYIQPWSGHKTHDSSVVLFKRVFKRVKGNK